MSNTISVSKYAAQPALRHGHVPTPASRAYIAWQQGKLDTGQLNQREAGKFFPALTSGLADPVAPTDINNMLPPPDGKIASANQGNGEFLDEPGTHWEKHKVAAGELLKFSWTYSAVHLTRRWNYFITRQDWDPSAPLSRAQFDAQPFFKVELTEQPFWSNGAALTPPDPTVHDVMLPQRSGYHVILAVWEVANTGNAFYQVIDVDFIGGDDNGEVTPVPPNGLRATEITSNAITLAWNTTATAVGGYRLYRDGSLIYAATQPGFIDTGLTENTRYRYSVSAVNAQGVESAQSQALEISTTDQTLPDAPPAAPKNLHSMGVGADSVSLMWGASADASRMGNYIVYRDGVALITLPVSQLSYKDTGLAAGTTYRYYIIARDESPRIN
ncbi:lytic polysaccharide monooxygenase [Candidatus Sodalis sp. SoCistrobi]|uniref:lytic polysaccharide monooxygenase n=1 Tax=Candidatus Sodalis sp. SoCistrobi TaxID=1922216 RepID=UPI000A020E6C|nr:lytic polysaccharide monooxygenase [Candidatus Sodalis sp. SoCistrobi]